MEALDCIDTPQVQWTYSSLKKFLTCPRQYFEVKVAKNYKEPQHESALYGEQFHKAAELFIADGTPLPPQFAYAQKGLTALAALPGAKYCEYKMGLRHDLTACDFDAEDRWWRGIADLVVLDGAVAKVLDYKTGASAKYADTGQLELMALGLFAHFPELEKVRGALWFVVAGNFIKANYTIDNSTHLWAKWMTDYSKLLVAHKTNVWNANPSGLCKKHCVVTSCPHNGRN